MKTSGDFIGYSSTGIDDAIENALQKAGEHSRFEIIETQGSQDRLNQRFYQVRLKTFTE